jgi:hypothetical protein
MSNSIRQKQYEKLFIRLSGHFLAVHLPDDFFTYEEEDQMQFIEDHAWQPFEDFQPEDVYDLIDNLTEDVMRLMEGTVT